MPELHIKPGCFALRVLEVLLQDFSRLRYVLFPRF